MNTMEDLLACRVCLATNVKLYDMYKYKLKSQFEIFSGIEMSPADNYPQYLCTYCTASLIKCAAFRDRSRRSQELLKYAQLKSQILTTARISSIAVTNNTRLPLAISKRHITTIIDPDDIFIKTEEPITDILLKEELSADQSDEEPLAVKVTKNKEKNDEEEGVMFESLEEEYLDFDAFDVNVENEFENINDSELLMNEIEVKFLTKEEQIQEVQMRKDSLNYMQSFYKCEYCYRGFITDSTYRKHMQKHDPSYGTKICDICKIRWPDNRSLRSHLTNAHERKYTCKLCGIVSRSSHKAKEHLQWHKGYKFICKVCGTNFSRSTSYLSHLRIHHPSKFCCDVCGECFIGEKGLHLHKKKAHRKDEKQNVKSQFKCDVCSTYFKCVDALKRHLNGYENGVCDNSQRTCFHCGENMVSLESLRAHLRTHDVRMRCEECDRSYATERSYSIHLARVHLGAKPKQYYVRKDNKKKSWVCEICGLKCISNCTLIYHQRTHTGEKPYECKECPKKFSLYDRLRIHIRTHTGERPFKCSSCPKAFKQKAALNRHDRVHSGVRPYQCGHCGKTFSQSNSMKVHVKTVHLKIPAPYRSRRNRNTELSEN